MDKIEQITIEPLIKSQFIKSLIIQYTQNKLQKSSQIIDATGSVSILIYNVTRDVLVFVKQFRPAVYFSLIPDEDQKGCIDIQKYSPALGMTLEICAGIIDKKASDIEIAKDEIFEECGYNVPIEKLEKIVTSTCNYPFIGSSQTTYYCEVHDCMKIAGKRIENETIDVIEMSVEDTKIYLLENSQQTTATSLFAFYWFLCNKYKKQK